MTAVDARLLDELKQLFIGKPGSCSLAFELISSEGAMATLRADQRVRPDQELVREVCRLCGANAVQLETQTRTVAFRASPVRFTRPSDRCWFSTMAQHHRCRDAISRLVS